MTISDKCTHEWKIVEDLYYPNEDGTKIIHYTTEKCNLCKEIKNETTESDNPCNHEGKWKTTGVSWCSMDGQIKRVQYECSECGYKKLEEEKNTCNHNWKEYSRRYDSARKDTILSLKCDICNGYSIEKPRIHNECVHEMTPWKFEYYDEIYETNVYSSDCRFNCGYHEAINEKTYQNINK